MELKELIEGRTVAICHSYGSVNYNLTTPNSDVDYKYYVMPTLDDLYSGKMFSTAKIGKEVDFDVHDIRKLPELLWKANVNFMEILTSNISVRNFAWGYFGWIEENGDAIAAMNLPYLYNSCVGMYYNKRKNVLKGTATTNKLVEEFGYDCKEAHHSIRVLDFLLRFKETGFGDFRSAIYYEAGSVDRDWMIALKTGAYSLEQYYREADRMIVMAERIKQGYLSRQPNEALKAELERRTKELVLKSIRSEV